MNSLHAYRERYSRELHEQVLPFWLKHSPDPVHGGFFTALDRHGRVYDTRKYVWLNGRQVWTLARLGHTDLARRGLDFLLRHAIAPDGRVWFSLSREGAPVYMQRKPYSAVFLALALSAFPDTRPQAIELFSRICDWIAHPEKLGRSAPPSQLADIYVMALLARELHLHDIERACVEGAQQHLRDGVLMENAGLPDSPEARLFCPGSSFEIAWILLQCDKNATWLIDVIDRTLSHWDEQRGGFDYFIDVEGQPLLQLEAPMRLWWVHVEALVAVAHAYKWTGDEKYATWFTKIDDYCTRVFRDPELGGEWFGYADRDGRLTHTLKGNNYKGCFHLPRALWTISKLLAD